MKPFLSIKKINITLQSFQQLFKILVWPYPHGTRNEIILISGICFFRKKQNPNAEPLTVSTLSNTTTRPPIEPNKLKQKLWPYDIAHGDPLVELFDKIQLNIKFKTRLPTKPRKSIAFYFVLLPLRHKQIHFYLKLSKSTLMTSIAMKNKA